MLHAIVDELTTWNPRERMGVFRKWLEGSLSLVHLNVLTVLEAAGPLSMSKLAEALDVSVASATGIVDRMEKRGLVERRHDDADRRVVLVHPTEPAGGLRRHGEMRRRGPAQGPRPADGRRADGAARRPPGDAQARAAQLAEAQGRIRGQRRNGRAQRPPPPGARGGDDMIGLLRTYLRPYPRPIVLVIGLLLVQAIGNLYLPDLNGDIINNGVAKGDTDYILRDRRAHARRDPASLGVASIIAVYCGAQVAMGFGRDVRSAIFRKVETLLARSRSTSSARRRSSPATRTTSSRSRRSSSWP